MYSAAEAESTSKNNYETILKFKVDKIISDIECKVKDAVDRGSFATNFQYFKQVEGLDNSQLLEMISLAVTQRLLEAGYSIWVDGKLSFQPVKRISRNLQVSWKGGNERVAINVLDK